MADPSNESSLTERLQKRLEGRAAEVKLKIIILGSGVRAGEVSKRDAVRQFLEHELPGDQVFFPEDIITAEMGNTFGLALAEVELLREADPDLIIALFPPDDAPSLYVELVYFARLRGIAERVRIFRSEDSVEAWNAGFRGNPVQRLYDITSFIDYPAESWETCEYIRPHALELAIRARQRRLTMDLLGDDA